VLGDGATIAQLSAALRALGQVGDPREDVGRGLLTPVTLERVTGLFGRGAAERVVIERAWSLEARLRVLAALGSGTPPLPLSTLTVVATDRRAGHVCDGRAHAPAAAGAAEPAVAAHAGRRRRSQAAC
jgi:hypothetical protein